MHFKRITENQAYRSVVEATNLLRSKGFGEPFDSHPEVIGLGLNLERCTTSGFGASGEGEYSALIVTDSLEGYRVIDVYIDTLCINDTSILDISDCLREDDPEHKRCDIRKPIPMAILYYLEQFGNLPERYEQYS